MSFYPYSKSYPYCSGSSYYPNSRKRAASVNWGEIADKCLVPGQPISLLKRVSSEFPVGRYVFVGLFDQGRTTCAQIMNMYSQETYLVALSWIVEVLVAKKGA